MARVLRTAVSLVLLCAACRMAPGELGESETSAGETSESGDSETHGDGDGDGDDCERDVPLSFGWSIGSMGSDSVELDWMCTVDTVGGDPGLDVVLDCPDADAPLELRADATPGFVVPLSGGETIRLRFTRWVSDGGIDQFLRVDVDSVGHLLTIVDSVVEPSSFELPFPIDLVPRSCEPLDKFCGPATRLALRFEVDGQDVEVLDGTHAAFGDLEVWVAEAWEVPDEVNSCTDAPWRGFRALLVEGG